MKRFERSADRMQRLIPLLLLTLPCVAFGAPCSPLREYDAIAAVVRKEFYVLIDDGVRSGKEWIAFLFKQQRQVTMVGSRTAGAFLGGAPFVFADGKYLMLLAVRAFQPPGVEPIEGIGVQPQVQVAPCRQYCADRDPQLQRALELIRAGD